MSTTISKPSTHVVEPAQTRQIAELARQSAAALQLHGLAPFGSAQVAPAPITIDDMNGEPLFHDYPLMDGNAVVGTIRTAANRKLGGQVISISHGPPGWRPDAARRMATESLHAFAPQAQVVGSELVSYAYPKVGVRLTYRIPGAPGTAQAVFDAASGERVPVGSAPADELQVASYSLLDRLAPEAPARSAAFAEAEQKLRSLDPDAVLKLGPAQHAGTAAIAAVNVPTTVPKVPSFISTRTGLVKQSIFCPNSPPGNSHYAQITNYFCVDASTQMLLEHYGYNYTQNQIATAMGTNAAQGGTTGQGLTSGFAQLTDNTLKLSFDNGASKAQQFADAMSEIDANRPLFTQVPHHYRVCMGYSEDVQLLALFGLAMNQMLYIYDPWPWNPDQCSPGAAYWETWSTSPVMWFGIVHHA